MDKYIEKRKHKEDRPVLAICYDFDRTLSPEDMQAQGYIQSVGRDIIEFWKESNALAEENDMDQNLAYMYKMVEEAEGHIIVTRKRLADFGARIKLYQGLDNWFSRINEYGKEKGVIIEHYIISSGLKEIIEGTPIAECFEKIYASSFYFNTRGVAKWPAQVVNYTNKTQFLFRIEKGVLDINDSGVNDSFAPDEIRIPFRNMIYIGDSDTDIPCMKLVTVNGGNSIAVYDPLVNDKGKAYKMMLEKRIKFYAQADYRDGSELDWIVKTIIDRTAVNEKIEQLHYEKEKEQVDSDNQLGEEKRRKIDLINALGSSRNFVTTHSVISKLALIKTWENEERERLFDIAVTNSQVNSIILDQDVKAFYSEILLHVKSLSENARVIKKILDSQN